MLSIPFLSRLQHGYLAESETRIVKPLTQKHFGFFCDSLGLDANNVANTGSPTGDKPIVLTGYQPGRPPKSGILVYFNRYIYFCQKNRYRNTLVTLACDHVAAMSVSRCFNVTTISLTSLGLKLDFVSRDKDEAVSAFLRHFRSVYPLENIVNNFTK